MLYNLHAINVNTNVWLYSLVLIFTIIEIFNGLTAAQRWTKELW